MPIAAATPVAAAIQLGGTPMAIDERGIPRMVRGGPALTAPDAPALARMHVERLAPAWGVRSGEMPSLTSAGEVPMFGATIVRLRQVIDGIPVDAAEGGELRVMVGSDGTLVSASGVVFAATTPHPAAPTFALDAPAAVARAVGDLYETAFAPSALTTQSLLSDGAPLLAGASSDIHVSMSRALPVWYPDDGHLIAAYSVEAYSSLATSSTGDAYRTMVDATTGRILKTTNLTADVAFNYRVFAETTGENHPFDGPLADVIPHPTGVIGSVPYPPFAPPNLVSVDGLNHPFGRNVPDPWLAANRTETNGNNVDAYTDLTAPDGLTFGDFRATLTGTRTFDRVYDPAQSAIGAQAQQMAGITSLFYLVNWLHDFWYDAGFTEAAGNGQNSNLGRGGQDRDAMLAEAQDNANGGSRNNANMSTPADGLPPRMQVFIWDGPDPDRSLAISGRKPATGPASFGVRRTTITAQVVLAQDGTAPASDGCQPLTAPVTGKIVLVDRGTCTPKAKAVNIQNAGGVAMIVASEVSSLFPPRLGEDAAIATAITIPAMSVLQSEGATIKGEIAAGPVTATLHRDVGPDAEGTLDATVIAHENGHYVHHRLTQCNTSLCGAMSEGWGDFMGLLVSARAGDNFSGSYPTGLYSTQSFPNDPVYYGIRRAPYSINKAINPLSFRHMSVGTPLPPPPFNGGDPAGNSEVHASGEVWASMMWEGYAALQQQPGAVFDDVRLKMRKYVVGGLLMAPTNATPTETRDSILAVAHAASPTDHNVLAAAYARRGFGTCAVSPPRDSSDFIGIIETTEVKGRLEVGAPSIQLVQTCDGDDVLDGGETARITVPLSNTGAAALRDVRVSLVSTTPGLQIAASTSPIGALAAFGAAEATFDVSLDAGVTTPLVGDLHFELVASNGCSDTQTLPLALRLNTDDRPDSSATETFDAGTTVWTTEGTSDVWSHSRLTPLDGQFTGVDVPRAADATLTSPLLRVGQGAFSIAFAHKFSFQANATTASDGGVIEYSLDDGTSWQDVSGLVNPGYNVTIAGTPDATQNALAGRPAFGGLSPTFPDTNRVTLNFGTRLAGKQLRLRFRIGTNATTGAPGWQVDNLAFTGIVGTPFPTLISDTSECGITGPDAGQPPSDGPIFNPGDAPITHDGGMGVPSDGGFPGSDAGHGHGHGYGDHDGNGGPYGCQAGGGTAGAGLALGALAVLLRRRRR